jgi:hypothetical protein
MEEFNISFSRPKGIQNIKTNPFQNRRKIIESKEKELADENYKKVTILDSFLWNFPLSKIYEAIKDLEEDKNFYEYVKSTISQNSYYLSVGNQEFRFNFPVYKQEKHLRNSRFLDNEIIDSLMWKFERKVIESKREDIFYISSKRAGDIFTNFVTSKSVDVGINMSENIYYFYTYDLYISGEYLGYEINCYIFNPNYHDSYYSYADYEQVFYDSLPRENSKYIYQRENFHNFIGLRSGGCFEGFYGYRWLCGNPKVVKICNANMNLSNVDFLDIYGPPELISKFLSGKLEEAVQEVLSGLSGSKTRGAEVAPEQVQQQQDNRWGTL